MDQTRFSRIQPQDLVICLQGKKLKKIFFNNPDISAHIEKPSNTSLFMDENLLKYNITLAFYGRKLKRDGFITTYTVN